ncbi:MAG: hypothetical protein IT373_14865 [Polyangiaceae bacterium]|nr:hypothetical protein [Polyangiaceae bacterium]
MLVIAMVGIIAALAIYGVSRQVASSRTAESKDKIRLICEAAVKTYVQDRTRDVNVLLPGAFSQMKNRVLCGSSSWVPDDLTKVKSCKKYQPNSAEGQDFNTGDWLNGWRCLHFDISDPIHYRYNYSLNDGDWSGTISGAGAPAWFVARAEGDLNGNGVPSRFLRGGVVENDEVRVTSALWVENETD